MFNSIHHNAKLFTESKTFITKLSYVLDIKVFIGYIIKYVFFSFAHLIWSNTKFANETRHAFRSAHFHAVVLNIFPKYLYIISKGFSVDSCG